MNSPPITAADLVADPTRIADVDAATARMILPQLTALASAVAAKLPVAPEAGAALEGPDRLMDVKEAAAMLGGVSEDFLYRSPAVRGLRVRIGGRVMFSYCKVQAFIARRLGRE